jgi:hypothetical protein
MIQQGNIPTNVEELEEFVDENGDALRDGTMNALRKGAEML